MLRKLVTSLLAAAITLPLAAQDVSFVDHASIPSVPRGSLIEAHGDFNNDGREDFLTFVSTASGVGVQPMISTGDGSYSAGAIYKAPPGSVGPDLVLADFNSDGKLDFAVAAGSTIFVYFGNGNGTFTLGRTISVGSQVLDIAAADFNHDSKTDLVVLTQATPNSNPSLNVYFGNGAGAFSKGPVTSSSFAANFLRTGDFDGDGKADVVTIFCQFGCVEAVFYGDGTGKFGSVFQTSTADAQFIVADVNGDKRSDLVGGNASDTTNGANHPYIQVLYGNANRTLTSQQIPTADCPLARQIAVGDFNGDGIPDLIVGESDCSESSPNTEVAFLPGHGNGSFGPEQFIFTSNASGGTAFDAAAILGDRDTEPDVTFTDTTTNPKLDLHVLLNSTARSFPSCAAPHGIRGINVCSPLAGSAVSSPVHFAIGSAGSVPMRKVEVWVDGKKLKEVFTAFSSYAFMDTHLTISAGTHSVVVFAAGWDNSLQRKSFSLTVR